MTKMKYVYGPVLSRRLGSSLGIDLVPYKTCTYDCIYCQCGRTTNKTLQRKEYVPIKDVLEEFKSFIFSYTGSIDYMTFSGCGEPTLNSGIGEAIRQVKQLIDKPVSVLTNGSLLWRPDVQDDLLFADVVLPSLDAGTQKVFQAINRPSRIKLKGIIDGLVSFRNRFKGRIWLEILLVAIYSENQENLDALKNAISRINPDKVQLNTVTRPPSEDFAYPVPLERMKQIAEFFGRGTEIIAEQRVPRLKEFSGVDARDRMLNLLARRPCKILEIGNSLGVSESGVLKILSDLERDKKVKYTVIDKEIYYHIQRQLQKELAQDVI